MKSPLPILFALFTLVVACETSDPSACISSSKVVAQCAVAADKPAPRPSAPTTPPQKGAKQQKRPVPPAHLFM